MSMACRICVVRSSGSGRRPPPGGGVRCGPGSTTWGPSSVGRHRGGWGFSPAEMALPNHPRWPMGRSGLQDCGDQWLLVQQHTWSSPEGRSRERAPLPHRLAAVKPQGSNTKLVGQLHPTTGPRAATAGCWPTVRRPPLVTRSPMPRTRGDDDQSPPAPSGSSATARAPRRRCGTSPSTWSSWWPAAPAGRAGGDPSRWTSTPSGSSWPRRRPRPAGRPPRPAAAGRTAISTPRGGSWTGELSWVGGDDQVLSPWRACWLVHQQIPAQGSLPTTPATDGRGSSCWPPRPAATAPGARVSGPTTAPNWPHRTTQPDV
jgi:hypothetical protein